MPGPRATDRDIRFILDELLLADRLGDLPQLGHATPQAMAEALAVAAHECAAVAPGFDDNGAGLDAAWRAAVAGGLLRAGGARASGGDGLPQLIGAAGAEMLAARSPRAA